MSDLVVMMDGRLRSHDDVDVQRRLRYGDPTLGWGGDESATVIEKRHPDGRVTFGVTAKDAAGERYCVFADHPRCDASLIRRLADADNRRSDALARAVRANEAADRSARSEEAARLEDMADRMHFALRQDLSQHSGGRRRLIPAPDLGRLR